MPDGALPHTPAAQRAIRGAFLPVLLFAAACAGPRAAAPPAPSAVPVGYEERGEASWYGPPYHGRPTASGEVYDMDQLTAAHPSLPLGTWVTVENLENGRIVDVRINDRGPFAGGRILDLSRAAARVLGAVGPGVIPVRLRVISLPGATPVASGGTFAVQAGSFAAQDRAIALRDEIRRTWPGAHVTPAGMGGRTLYRVRIGGFAARADAQQVARQLATAGYTVIVVEE